MADRDRILASLTRKRTELEARYRGSCDDVPDTPCTRSEDPDGRDCTPQDHLAHLLRVDVAANAHHERQHLAWLDEGLATTIADGDR